MSRINVGRVVLAGLVAGVVMCVIGSGVNAGLLAKQWDDAAKVLALDMQKIQARSAIGWVVMELLIGLAIAWTYAAVRPRLGAGAGTGLRTGLVAWVISEAALVAAFNGLYPDVLITEAAIGNLVACLAGGWVASALYREAE
jgi:hypothetical protein